MVVYEVTVECFQTIDARSYSFFRSYPVGIYATRARALAEGVTYAAEWRAAYAGALSEAGEIDGNIVVKEVNVDSVEMCEPNSDGALRAITTYTPDGTLLERMVFDNDRTYEAYPEDASADAGTRFCVGDIVTDKRWEEAVPLIVRRTPDRAERPWENVYHLYKINELGGLLCLRCHERWLTRYTAAVSEPVKCLAHLLRGDLTVEDYVWELLRENRIDFSTDRVNWYDLFVPNEM